MSWWKRNWLNVFIPCLFIAWFVCTVGFLYGLMNWVEHLVRVANQ